MLTNLPPHEIQSSHFWNIVSIHKQISNEAQFFTFVKIWFPV
jgi:hypothetical protein